MAKEEMSVSEMLAAVIGGQAMINASIFRLMVSHGVSRLEIHNELQRTLADAANRDGIPALSREVLKQTVRATVETLGQQGDLTPTPEERRQAFRSLHPDDPPEGGA